MLRSEFESEWNVQSEAAGKYCGLPHALEADEVEYFMALYGREELDAVCVGIDRHARFVKWARNHYAVLARDVEVERARYRWALLGKAETRELGGLK